MCALVCVNIYMRFCRVAEPMDSVCDGAGPREPSKVCQAEIQCVLSSDTQTGGADNPAITELQKDEVDVAPASLELSRQDGETPDGITKAKVPKPGTICHSDLIIVKFN